METAAPPVETPSLAQEENADGYAVSSRGRVRKVKKMVNYDGLDFEKLALQASEEAEQERVRKRKKREDDEKEREEKVAVEEPTNSLPTGVHRYLLSQAGHVMGYIDNKGHVHSGAGSKIAGADRTKVDLSSVQNLASHMAKKEGTATPTRPGMVFPKKTFQNLNLKPNVPTVVVAAINDQGSPVYVRVVGEQALQLVRYMRPSIKGRVSQIKLQHHGQTYTVNTNAHMITNNIPGLPDGEATVKPSPSVATATSTSSATTPKPLTNLQSLATNNSPSVPRVAPISSVVSGVSSPNTLALAYRGVTKPTTVSAPVQPLAVTIPKTTMQQDSNRLSSVAHTRLVSASPSVVSSVVPPTVRTQTNLGSSPTKHGNFIAINQSGNRQTLPTIVAPARPQVTPVVNRIGVPANSAATVLQSEGSSVRQTNVQQPVVAVQSPSAVAVAPTQPLGQTVTATPVAVSGPGGQTQVQLKLESESLAQLMQRTGSKIVALPNGRGGYTLSLTPGAVQPGQKSQTQIAANTAAKVQVVSGANALLEDTLQTQDVQQQSQVVQQQSHVISQGVAQPAVVSQQTSLAQQIGVKQVVPVNVSPSGQVVSRVSVQPRVFGNLVSSPQGTRTTQVPVTGVIASHQQGGTIINSSQATGVLQKMTTTQSQLTSAQAGQHQIVLQQRVAATGTQSTVSPQLNQGVQQAAATYKQVVVNQSVQQVAQQVVQVAQGSVLQQHQQQVVRLQPVSGSGGHRNTPTQKLVQIVQPGGSRQVVQMVQQVVASQGQANQGHQQLIYVQGNGQVIQQQPAKANIGTVQHTLQGTATLQQGQVQQNIGEQKLQQQLIQQQTPGQSQQHLVQQKQQVAQTQVMQQQLVVQQPQQQQPQQQQVVSQQQQQTVVQQQQTVVQQQPVVQQQQVVQQQGRLVLVRTSQGEQMALQLPDGRVSLLTQEQLQAAVNNGSIKFNQNN